MAEEAQKGAATIGKPAVIKIDPLIAEENLFRKLHQQVIESQQIAKIINEYIDNDNSPYQVMALVHVLMRQTIGTTLGYIIPPEAGARIVKDRIVQSATLLLDMLRSRVRQIELEIEQSIREGKDYEVEKNVRKLISIHHQGLIAIREVMNRYLILYTINLPSNLRPPLAQIKLGLEVINP